MTQPLPTEMGFSGFCFALGHLSEEEIAFQHISLIRIM